jgi:ATP-dependent Lon protease
MDKAQREYFLREQLKAIRRELGDKGGDGEEMEELRSHPSIPWPAKKVKKEADKQLSRLESMHPTVPRPGCDYLDWIIDLP